MINLASTSDLLRVITDSTASLDVQASWVDLNGPTVTPGRTNTATIVTATTTTVRQYLRWQIVLGTATSVTFALGFFRA